MMVQKEVGDRFTTKPGSREYGSITVLLNYFYEVKKEFFVSRKQFVPEPNVDSEIVSFKERKDKLPLKDFSFFETILKDSFQFKRKTIKNNLKKYDLKKIEEVLNKYGFDLSVRAEMLSVDVFVEIANELYK
jgi:16S rRNA (adenine1518-N6/adenine1519-N6)-dimethyltransferase